MKLDTRMGLGVLGLLLAATSALGQQVYRFVDESGRVVFTDKPPEGSAAEAIPLPEHPGSGQGGSESVAERIDRLMDVADQLQADRLAREQKREADRRAARAAEPPPPPEPPEAGGVSIGTWYPGPIRPVRPWWPWVPGYGPGPGYPPPPHPGYPPPPGHKPGPEMPGPPPLSPPGGRLTWPSGR